MSEPRGRVILNADDWGRDAATTDRTMECFTVGALSSVSAMVFMEDSERAAELARQKNIDAGLHLNFTATFTSPSTPEPLAREQSRLAAYLRRNRLAQTLFHPGLASSFAFVVKAQLEEFQRLFGKAPARVDGHHHMHLCANVVRGKLLPEGTVVRRNFSFAAGEKNFINRFYRRAQDQRLARRHPMTDFLFSLPPIEPERLNKIANAAQSGVVEVETHPVNPREYTFFTTGEVFRWLGAIPLATSYQV
jgi:chitin disaccharide deacetylase